MKKEHKQRLMEVLRTQYSSASKREKGRIIERVALEFEVWGDSRLVDIEQFS
jgi:hypothetical protein